MPRKLIRRSITTMGDLNLAPIMNLMVTLIPMLLLSASFIQIVILDTSLPVYGENTIQSEKKLEKPKLGLTILIKEEGFSIGGQGGMLKLSDGGNTINKLSDGTYDYLTLSSVLFGIKEKYPDEWSVIIVPEYSTVFDVIVLTMDASRVYSKVDESGKLIKKTMFPNVTIGGGVI